MRIQGLDAVRQLASRALASGAERRAISSVEWDTCPRCASPVLSENWGRGLPNSGSDLAWRLGVDASAFVDVWVPCRKCPSCLKSRANLWSRRAEIETVLAERTWFCTWTLRPEEQYAALCAGVERFGCEDEFITRHLQISEGLLTPYLKRVRKESGCNIRYILVAERHKSGLPHYHGLIHERGVPVRKRTLVDQWRSGFSSHKLVAEENLRVAAYVAKYLAKSKDARVRASIGYGRV